MKVRIVHLSDTHGKHKTLEIPECDILIHSGDFSPIGELHSIKEFLAWFKRQVKATHKVFMAGNHDRKLDPKFQGPEDLRQIREIFAFHREGEHFHYLCNNSIELMGLKIWGSPITPWFHGEKWAFNKHRGDEIDEVWKKIPMETDIVVTHGPVKHKLDKLYLPPTSDDPPEVWDGYAGCDRLAYHIKRVKPILHLSGHIHEGYGYVYDEHTNYFNGSICTLWYEPENKPWIIDLDTETKEIEILNEKV